MAPSTRSSAGKENLELFGNSPGNSSSDTKPFLALYDVMTELKAISSQHARFTREISILNNRIDKLSQTLKQLKDGDLTEFNTPLRTNIKPLTKTNDVENPIHLHDIQSALVQEGTYYHLWLQRVCYLFQGDFRQVNTFCNTHRPTWPKTIGAILQILAFSYYLRSPVDAFTDFRNGPLQSESTAQFLKRLEQAFHRMPVRERNEREVECAIEYTLQTHAGIVWSTLIQQNNAYPLHNALSIALTIAEKHQN
ncbi:hypothetical protein EPUL_004845 [Erysiphe pulchra]|uniref:Uncharacterized protein n=1 Tax=Erysiphe pulchra TaxID=225359 RepID=A0A2S4PQX6_9PEZI|nr:hypothetical protein EPUL_004845 [Erysiphe pulchra]